MTALTVVSCVLAAAVVLLVVLQAIERQRWAEERKALVDRAIARHTGEVLALDRQPKRSSLDNHVERAERPTAVGL